MLSGDRMGRGTPVFHLVTLVTVRLNAVTYVTINFRSETEANGSKLQRFRKMRWVAIIDPFEK